MSAHSSQKSASERASEAEHNSQAEKVSVDSRAEDEEAIAPAPGVDLRISPKEHHGTLVLMLFNICAFIAFALMLAAACPVAWLQASNGDKWTLWKDSNNQRWQKNECDHQKHMFMSMEAYTVASVVFLFMAFIAGMMQYMGAGHMGVTLSIGILAMSTSLVSWALIVHQYHKYNCPGVLPGVNGVSRLNRGFALSICAFGLMAFGDLGLGYYFYTYFAEEESAKESYSAGAYGAFFMLMGAATISSVGTAFTMWEAYYAEATVKVTLWHVEIFHRSIGLSEFWSISDYNCKALKTYFKVGQAFAIIGDAFLFIAMLAALAAVYTKSMKMAAVGASAASWVFLLISWAIMIGARYKKFCNGGSTDYPVGLGRGAPLANGVEQSVTFEGFVITEGLGMIISAFCVAIVSMVLLLVKA